jgi:hypothetical protein
MTPTPAAFDSVLARELAAHPEHQRWLAAAVRQFLGEAAASPVPAQIVLVAPNWVGVFDILTAPAGSDTVILREPPLLPPSPSDSEGDDTEASFEP